MQNGWIKLHRKLLENPISNKSNYLSLWITLLLLANHKEKKIMWNKEIIIIKEGQVLTGRKELSRQTGIPETTIERALEQIEKNGHQIEQQKTTKFRIITILNWKEYQKADCKTDNKRTTNGQQTDTNKNDKNDKNIIPKGIRAKAQPREDINILIEKLNKMLGMLDESKKTQRWYAKLFLDSKTPEILARAGNPAPTKEQIINATLRLFQLAMQDSFHQKNCRNMKYVYNKSASIATSQKTKKYSVDVIS